MPSVVPFVALIEVFRRVGSAHHLHCLSVLGWWAELILHEPQCTGLVCLHLLHILSLRSVVREGARAARRNLWLPFFWWR